MSIPAPATAGIARSARMRLILAAIAVAALAALPAVLSAYWVKVWLAAVIYTVAASGVALLYARLGLVSLAQVALTGVGGWVCLRVAHATGAPFEVAMLAGASATAAVGVIVGLPALRMRGLYLALVTLMAAGGFTIVVTAVQFPNGGEGFSGYGFDPRPMPRPLLAQSDEALLRYAVVMALLGYGLIGWHLKRAPGRAWALIRRSEAVAMSAGVDVVLYKCWAFALSGFLAGMAGSLLAATLGTLDARSFPASESILLFALTVVGGAFSPLGQVVSGVLYRVVPALLDTIGVDGNLSFVIFGAALLQALITAPRGVAGQVLDAVERVRQRRSDAMTSKGPR
ncbi:MAG: branched-chain amino acid ABC transporter permease [Chitinophagaceae bacterium]|nr:branched-chain amino acid ABC transporter permease [Rubrivivax sp.]